MKNPYWMQCSERGAMTLAHTHIYCRVIHRMSQAITIHNKIRNKKHTEEVNRGQQ